MKSILTALVFISILLFSCKKESIKTPDGNDNTINGTWDVSSTDVLTKNSKEFKIRGLAQKTETVLNYTTENNTGKLVITDSTITTIELAYTISSKIKTYNYKNGVLSDSSEKPYNISFYEPQSFCSYKTTGNDSISFTSGGLVTFSDATLRASASGAEMKLNGDTLIIKQDIHIDSSEVRLGIVYHTIQTGTATMTLLRHRN